MSTSRDAAPITFAKSPVPPNPLGEGRTIKTAAALMIGWVIISVGWLEIDRDV